jgi:hypothetical protein
MKPSVLFIIKSDPRTSHRPAEAIRIAAGVGVWQKVEVTLYLHQTAVLALSEFPDELVDEENYRHYLPMVGEFGRPIYVQRAAPLLKEIGRASLPFEEISESELAALAGRSTYLLRF